MVLYMSMLSFIISYEGEAAHLLFNTTYVDQR